ncbi:hypothetical protein F4778DRAFT_778161 [Xylariomycetidae sp. FL2044]|nr:hypothetical protein F4778DRAFT_778161 [Xylariomycetidae sp. FL2044]
MAGIPGFVGFALDEGVSSSSSPLLRRQSGCVVCESGTPDCPEDCADGYFCNLIYPINCQECPKSVCTLDASDTGNDDGKKDTPNAGAIAGGVIGGLIAIAIVTYLVWRFCIKNKRRNYEQEHWNPDPERTKEGMENDFASRRSHRASTHTVNSIASTVLTRASNIIQIAYIPGVTNRATPTSPTLLVPPVPPIPIAHSGNSSPYEDQHFFVPDLRDSTYSGMSAYTDRTSYARTSYAPRSSVASTIYGKNAVVSPLPAQKGNFLKPSIVSVKSRATSSSGESDVSTPPVPTVDYGKYDQPPPSPAFSIGATFFKNASASTATTVRPQMVRVGSGPKTVDIKSNKSSATAVDEDDEPEPLVRLADQARNSNAVTIIDDTPTIDQGPFSDPPRGHHKKNSSLSAVIEDAAKRAAGRQSSASTNRNRSPFGDEHALKED